MRGISGLWYGPCVMRPGRLETEEGLVPTPWEQAIVTTLGAAMRAGSSAERAGASVAG